MAAAGGVEDDVGIFVTVGTVVDEFQVVELLSGGGNGEGYFVGGFVEAFDVACACLGVS